MTARKSQVASIVSGKGGVGKSTLAVGLGTAASQLGKQVLVVRMNKNKKFQKDSLIEQGYSEFREFYKNPLAK